jgi:hypothetical protein
MVKRFKFFDGDWQQPPLDPIDAPDRPDIPLLENEQVIRYWNDGDYHNILYERIIAWASGIHIFADNWIQKEYEGTMEGFFNNRLGLGIPVIQFIEPLIPGGSTFTEDDRYYLDNNNFHYPVKIIYYEYETI